MDAIEKKKSLKKNIIIIGIILCILIVYLLFANKLVLNGRLGVTKVNNWRDILLKDDVYTGVDHFRAMGDLMQTISFDGWAFVNTEEDNSNKEIGLIFVNGDSCYMVKTDSLIKRDDVWRYFNQNGCHVKDENNGFGISFSVIDIPSGRYHVAIYCKENDNNYGVGTKMAHTYYDLIKSGDTIDIVEVDPYTFDQLKAESVSDWENTLCKDDIIAAFDSCSVNTDNELSVTFDGWTFVNKDTESTEKT